MSHKFETLGCWIAFALIAGMFSCVVAAQTRKPGSGAGYGEVEVGSDVHHDLSKPLIGLVPLMPPRHKVHTAPTPFDNRAGAAADKDNQQPDLVNGATGAATTLSVFNVSGVGNYFNGPDGGFTPATTPSDAIGAVGTTQYLQWVDDSFAVFSKSTGNAQYGPAAGNTIWSGFGGPCEANNDGQPTVNFDRMAGRWVVSQHAAPAGGPYYQCVAVSTTADATGTWNRYSFQISDVNAGWENLNAKLGVWPDGYYMGFDMYGGTTFEGTKFCALNRAKMLLGQTAGIQCIQLGQEYYSPIISDLDGATPPPSGAPAYFAADDLGFYALDFFKFHVNWTDSQDTTLSLAILLPEPPYGISCGSPCILQPNSTSALNPHGSHVLGRMPYRNFGSYQSLLAVENTETVTTPIFYEARVTSTGDLYMYQEGELQIPNSPAWRFNPSIAEDRAGNIAVAYNASSTNLPPSQFVSSRAPGDPVNTLGNETLLNPGNGSQTTPEWDQRASLTLDPIDDCTFYYTQQYQPMDGTENWSTQIEAFTLAGCYQPLTIATVPAGLKVTASGSGNLVSQLAPVNTQFPVGSLVALSAPSPQSGGPGSEFVFAGWSDGGAESHYITMPSNQANYIATFNLEYYFAVEVGSGGGGTVAPSGASLQLAGSTVNVTANPSVGYGFTGWTGNVASPSSSTTSVNMIQPETVIAHFAPLPTAVNAALASQSGPQNARVWTFTLSNTGPGQANGIYLTSFALKQTAGTTCRPTLLTPFPVAVGNEAPSAALSVPITINFTGCAADALFSLTIGNEENNAASHSIQALTGLSQ
jgi:hypothetical protein